MRQAIARVTVRSKTENPHYYIDLSIDMTSAMSKRQGLNEEIGDTGPRISVNDMIVRACAKAIAKYPKLNTTFAGDHLISHADINIGIAIALEVGLMVPAILRTQNMSLLEISVATKDLASAAKSLKPSTKDWFATARNYALYSNQGGLYDDILDYLNLR
jgi:pyruvate dehydrogenase E2 component (dihydrolipoamide acetyltransferase)